MLDGCVPGEKVLGSNRRSSTDSEEQRRMDPAYASRGQWRPRHDPVTNWLREQSLCVVL